MKIRRGIFEKFCIDHKEIPADEVNYDKDDKLDDDKDVDNDTDDENVGKKFRVFITTER